MSTIRLDDVGKRYIKYEDAPTLLGHATMRFRAETGRSALWAIRHVDLDVDAGETIGVIGRNGSGKSTLLGMVAGVTAPTEGRVQVRGRVAPLISVGVGFHPELTGRENVFVNGIILGMSRAEVERRLDAIVAFSEIEAFIDTPVKFYSSGMFVRLGFSVAVAAEPDVLLVDEVLAVGDLSFQHKCFDRMTELQDRGTTIFVVSHNLNAVRNLCRRTLVVHDGGPRFLGPTAEAISEYHRLLDEQEGASAASGANMTAFELFGPDGQPTAHVRYGDDVTFRTTARFPQGAPNPVFGLHLETEDGVLVYVDSTHPTGTRDYAAGETGTCRIRLPARLPTGSYVARGILWWGFGDDAVRVGSPPLYFFVSGRPLVKGAADLHASFEIDSPSGG